jgi:hypothetical protein
LIFAILWLAASIGWPYAYYRAIDPHVRRVLGARLGVEVIWTHDARRYIGPARYRRWRWGIANAPADQVTFPEAVVHALCAVVVNVLAGLLTPAVLFAAMFADWLQPLVLYPLLFVAIGVYAIYWGGIHRPPLP